MPGNTIDALSIPNIQMLDRFPITLDQVYDLILRFEIADIKEIKLLGIIGTVRKKITTHTPYRSRLFCHLSYFCIFLNHFLSNQSQNKNLHSKYTTIPATVPAIQLANKPSTIPSTEICSITSVANGNMPMMPWITASGIVIIKIDIPSNCVN
ncbi:hypothetical protein D3C73_1105750 [compost metagenome]